MAIKKGNKRLTVDLEESTYNKLDTLVSQMYFTDPPSITKGFIFNYLLKAYLDLDDDSLMEMSDFCKERAKFYWDRSKEETGYKEDELYNKTIQFKNLYHMFNKFSTIEKKEEGMMKRLEMNNAFVIFPDNWIVLNQDESSFCEFAYALEIRDQYSIYNVPHFLYLSNTEDIDENHIYSLACEKYPKFKSILSMQTKAVYGRNEKGEKIILNSELIDRSPLIGIFRIYDYGEKPFGEYPYGAMIVRKNKIGY